MPKRRANGEGTIYQRKDGLWAAQFTDNTGKRRTVYGKRQMEVRYKLKEAQRQSDDGMSMDKSKITFAAWLEEWLEVYIKPTCRKGTYANYHDIVYKHVIPAFPKVLLKDLRTDMLQKFFNGKSTGGRLDGKEGGLTVGFLSHMKISISTALKQAVENGIVSTNVITNVKLPKSKSASLRVLAIDEQKKLEQAISGSSNPLAFALLLDLYTGLRAGELIELKISDIDFEKNEIRISRTRGRISTHSKEPIAGARSEIIVNDPKTAAGKRTIPLPSFIVSLLKQHIEDREMFVEAMKSHWAKEKAEGWIDEGHIFITRIGTVPDRSNMWDLLKKLAIKAKIEHVGLHALRHTFTTRCIESGFDVRTLADILGHSDVKMTLNVYAHAMSDQKRNNMEKLSGLYKLNETEKRQELKLQ